MTLISWTVPVIASALLIWFIAIFLSPPHESVSIGGAIGTAVVLMVVNGISFYFLRPSIGTWFVLVALVVGALAVKGITKLSFLRSCILLFVCDAVSGLAAHFVANYHA